jgi:hypothetical protein
MSKIVKIFVGVLAVIAVLIIFVFLSVRPVVLTKDNVGEYEANKFFLTASRRAIPLDNGKAVVFQRAIDFGPAPQSLGIIVGKPGDVVDDAYQLDGLVGGFIHSPVKIVPEGCHLVLTKSGDRSFNVIVSDESIVGVVWLRI